MWYNKGVRKQTFGVAFDIGTSSVSAVVFSTQRHHAEHSRPAVHGVHRSFIESSLGVDPENLPRHIISNLHHILSKVEEQLKGLPKEIVIGLAAPYYVSRTLTVSSERKGIRDPITQAEIDRMLRKGENNFKKSVGMGMQEQYNFFTRRPLKILVNGYRVSQPVGLTGELLEVFARYEATAAAFKNRLLQAFQSFKLDAAHVHLTSMPTAYFHTLKHIMDLEEGATLIDIGGEVTEISIMHGGILQYVISIPAGMNVLIRRVAELLNVTFHDALFIVKRYAEHTLEEAKSVLVTPLIEAAVADWKSALSDEMVTYAEGRDISPFIFLTGGGAILPVYQGAFTSNFLKKILPFGEATITSIKPEALRELFSSYCCFGGPEDFGLACLALLLSQDVI